MTSASSLLATYFPSTVGHLSLPQSLVAVGHRSVPLLWVAHSMRRRPWSLRHMGVLGVCMLEPLARVLCTFDLRVKLYNSPSKTRIFLRSFSCVLYALSLPNYSKHLPKPAKDFPTTSQRTSPKLPPKLPTLECPNRAFRLRLSVFCTVWYGKKYRIFVRILGLGIFFGRIFLYCWRIFGVIFGGLFGAF